MDKKTLFALLLILVVFWISSEYIWKPNQQNIKQEQQTQQQVETTKQDVKPKQLETDKQEVIDIPESNKDDVEINDSIILENDKFLITFSNRGGVINSVQLKDYVLADKTTMVQLIPEQQKILDFNLLNSSGNSMNTGNIVFQYVKDRNKISFFTTNKQRSLEKKYILSNDYNLDLEIRIDNADDITGYELSFDSGIADTEKYLKTKSRDYRIVYQANNENDDIKLSKLDEEQTINGNFNWAAIKSKYFSLALLPDDLVDSEQLRAYENNDSPAMSLLISNNRTSIEHNYSLYMGPLLQDHLKILGNGLQGLVDMGPSFLQWLSNIFKLFLNFLYSIIPIWGICIIIFAIILKLLLYPLTHKAFESSTKMQKVQPIVKEIQAKYKSDPKTMNAEMKKVYKEHGVNPLGGCLPMLLQMPVIFALYPILRYSISLRQASFLWLPDLSEPDPVWALPIVMAVFMFVQQKLMSPAKKTGEDVDEKAQAAQQSQKMMMYIMPIVMFFIFKGLSSGLVLYWTVFSIIGSIQQYFIKKKFK